MKPLHLQSNTCELLLCPAPYQHQPYTPHDRCQQGSCHCLCERTTSASEPQAGCRCQDGLVIGNGTTPVNIDEFYYLATVNDAVTDDYGRTFPGNSAFNQSEQSVQCWNDSNSIFVHIIDSCPAFQVCCIMYEYSWPCCLSHVQVVCHMLHHV